jgi:alkanesulfonate monooxygenase SsuD/methylene tetrahydromethanopterin reductase-like flavin-dependent oxidoreductase (luciferase family)
MLSIPRQGELLLGRSGLDLSILPPIRAHVAGYPHRGNPALAAQYVPPEVAERLALIGSREQVLARLDEYREAGVEIPVMGLAALRGLYSI